MDHTCVEWAYGRGLCLLGNEEHIDCAEIELVKKWKGCQSIVCWMLTSIELEKINREHSDATHWWEEKWHTMTVLPLYCTM